MCCRPTNGKRCSEPGSNLTNAWWCRLLGVPVLWMLCPGGETGRRNGLKIRFSVRRVWVQVPPRAPVLDCFFQRKIRCEGQIRTCKIWHHAHATTPNLIGMIDPMDDLGSFEQQRAALLERMKYENRPGALFRLERQLQAVERLIFNTNGDDQSFSAQSNEPAPPAFQTVREYLMKARTSIESGAKLMPFRTSQISS